MAPTLVHPKGQSVTVPEASVEYYTDKGWKLAGSEPEAPSAPEVVVIPEGAPSDDWKVKQLEAYATREEIETPGAKTKQDYLDAFKAAAKAKEAPANAPAGEPSGS